MDYESGTTGCIWTIYSGMSLFVCFYSDIIAGLINILFPSLPKFSSSSSYCKFSENYLNTYSVLTKMRYKNKTRCKAGITAKEQIY